jgi:hypothetical protein
MRCLGRCFIETGVFNLRIDRTNTNGTLSPDTLSSAMHTDFVANSEQVHRNIIAKQALALAVTDIAAAMELVETELPFEFMLHATR